MATIPKITRHKTPVRAAKGTQKAATKAAAPVLGGSTLTMRDASQSQHRVRSLIFAGGGLLGTTDDGELLIELHGAKPVPADELEGVIKHVRRGLMIKTGKERYRFPGAPVRDAELQRLVDASDPKADKANEIEARLRSKAVSMVMGGTAWLTASELGQEMHSKPSNAHTVLGRWLEQGRIFALEKNGVRIYPRYAFDAMGEPVPLLKEVLTVLAGRSPFQIAAWFESTSSHLNGKRPREVLESDGLAVVTAAKRHVEGPVHG